MPLSGPINIPKKLLRGLLLRGLSFQNRARACSSAIQTSTSVDTHRDYSMTKALQLDLLPRHRASLIRVYNIQIMHAVDLRPTSRSSEHPRIETSIIVQKTWSSAASGRVFRIGDWNCRKRREWWWGFVRVPNGRCA